MIRRDFVKMLAGLPLIGGALTEIVTAQRDPDPVPVPIAVLQDAMVDTWVDPYTDERERFIKTGYTRHEIRTGADHMLRKVTHRWSRYKMRGKKFESAGVWPFIYLVSEYSGKDKHGEEQFRVIKMYRPLVNGEKAFEHLDRLRAIEWDENYA